MADQRFQTPPRTYASNFMADARRRIFLKTLAETGCVRVSARVVGLHKSSLYEARQKNLAFKQGWAEALQVAAGALEDEARRRAVEGWEEPVYQHGKMVGTIHRHSDRLLEMLVRGYNDRFRTTRQEIANAPGQILKIETGPTQAAQRIAVVLQEGLWAARAGRHSEGGGATNDHLEGGGAKVR
ncbi:MAG: hypothetical protein HQL90_07780 [Magnetococcales bacterium]|nr:hypothetical protein [Magnetococcales bacterium]